MSLTLEQAPLEDLLLEFDALAFIGVGGAARVVGLGVNGVPAGHACFGPDPKQAVVQAVQAIRIPHGLVGKDRTMRLTFHAQSVGSILSHGLGGDDRLLSIGLRNLLLRRA